jgi:hypothetical protein
MLQIVLTCVFGGVGTFHGEDLQMGLILHKMNRDYRMKAVGMLVIHIPPLSLSIPLFVVHTNQSQQSVDVLHVSTSECIDSYSCSSAYDLFSVEHASGEENRAGCNLTFVCCTISLCWLGL